jgi:hypothetical protein
MAKIVRKCQSRLGSVCFHSLWAAPIDLSGSFFHGNQSASGLRTRTVTMDKTRLKGCLILIVEDYKDTRDAIRLFLEFCEQEFWLRPPDEMV